MTLVDAKQFINVVWLICAINLDYNRTVDSSFEY